jgi:hypothetical protein
MSPEPEEPIEWDEEEEALLNEARRDMLTCFEDIEEDDPRA